MFLPDLLCDGEVGVGGAFEALEDAGPDGTGVGQGLEEVHVVLHSDARHVERVSARACTSHLRSRLNS